MTERVKARSRSHAGRFSALVALLVIGIAARTDADLDHPAAAEPKLTIYVTRPEYAGEGVQHAQFVWQSWTAKRNDNGQWVFDERRWRRFINRNFGVRPHYRDSDAPVFLNVEYPDARTSEGRRLLRVIADVLLEERPGREVGYFRMFPPKVYHAVRRQLNPEERAARVANLERTVRAAIAEGVTEPLAYVSPWCMPLPNEEWFRANVRESVRLAATYGKPVRPTYSLSPHPAMTKLFDRDDLLPGDWLRPEVVRRHLEILYEEGVRELVVAPNSGGKGKWPVESLEILQEVAVQ